MSKRRNWKGTKKRPRTEAQHKAQREWEALSPEEKRAAQREQFLEWLEMFQGEEPILHLNGKPQPHNPMSQEEADLHLALFDKEIEPTRDIQVQLAQLELLRQPDSGKHHFKLWKLMFPEFFARG
jgi:hypothetical protein